MAKKRNLVVGAVRGYGFTQLQPFVVSLKQTSFDGDLVLLWSDLSAQTRADLQAHGVKLVPFSYRGSGALNSWSRFWPVLGPVVRLFRGSALAHLILKTILPLQSARFLAYRDFWVAHREAYQNVLITDVRDVLFQGDPFASFKGGLLVFEEDGGFPLGDEKMFNAPWIEDLFGLEALAEMGHFPILCSGTTMGDSESLIRYLTGFELLLCRAQTIGAGGSDQGVHNYLCRHIMQPWFQVAKNGEGPVLSMVPTLRRGIDFEIADNGVLLNSNGSLVPVLHQYDRHQDLATVLLRRQGCPAPEKSLGKPANNPTTAV